MMLTSTASAAAGSTPLLRLLLVLCVASVLLISSTNAIGVNFGQQSDSLPSDSSVLQLIQSTTINKVKIYGADPGVLTTFAGTGIEIIVGVDNSEVDPMANSPGYATAWVQNNVAAYPSTSIVGIALGNEVFTSQAQLIPSIVPGLQNLQAALVSLGLDQQVKVSTPHSLGVLGNSYPPSAGAFSDGNDMGPLLAFLSQTQSPFMVNVYPFFAYESNSDTISLDYCLLNPGAPSVIDSGTGLTYTNMFDAELDAVYAAMSQLGYPSVSIFVTETEWPSAGDPNEVGASVPNAQSYISNLVQHINSGAGTPAKPGVSVDTYLFALYNEDLKQGPTSERNYGLYNTDGIAVYNSGC